MLAPDAKHMYVDATAGKTYRMALVRPLERQILGLELIGDSIILLCTVLFSNKSLYLDLNA